MTSPPADRPPDPQVNRALSRLIVALQTLPEVAELKAVVASLLAQGIPRDAVRRAYALAAQTSASAHHGQTGRVPAWEDLQPR